MRKRVLKTVIVFSLVLMLCMSGATAWADVTPPAGPEQIALSLTGEPTEMAVSWCDRTDSVGGKSSGEGTAPVGAAVYYRIQEDTALFQIAEAKKTVAGDGYQYYETIMKGLTPGQTYSYKVVTPMGESALRSFSAAADLDSTDDFQFLYLGDVQTKASNSMADDFSEWSALIKGAVERNPKTAFLLQGGDLINQGSDLKEWQALLSRGEATLSTVPFLSVPGNHEANGDTTGKPELWSGIFNLPKNGPDGFSEEFYSFDYGDSHILCLNSNVLSDEQLNLGSMTAKDFDRIKSWMVNDLERSDKTWNIVVLHHPAYSVASDPVAERVLSEWAPIFEDYNVSLVFCGHQHVYMRTKAMFDRDVSTKSGITYIMGNSGSKFYSVADQEYAAKMLGNVSNYQRVQVSSEEITVTTFDAEGTELDSAVITPRTSEARKITLSYGAGNATVTAPEEATAGASVTVNVSNLAPGKSVYDVTAKDKNGITYPVTVVTKNTAYSFSMPDRSVTVEVLFEDSSSSGSDGKAYEFTPDNGGDPIWNIAVASSGLEENKIKSGSTVFVTVTRENEAISAALKGIRITSGNTEVTAPAEGSVSDKKGKFKFTMPAGAVRIQVEAEYKPLKIYVRETKNDAYVQKKTLDRDAMPASAGTAYYSGYDRYPTAVIGKATEFVTLKELLKEY
ncbi:MAG: putative phosphohydrolase, partial [Bacillota bacterium]|nr:putative phosphohydrolase [Bacillota bacterium]